MANQYKVNHEKVTDVLWLHYFERWTINDLCKTLRLNPKTIRRILKKERETWQRKTRQNPEKEIR